LKTLTPKIRREAFTLLELLISIGIGCTMFGAMMLAMSGNMKSLAMADDYSGATQAEVRAMDYIMRDLRRASSVTIPTGGNSVSLTIPDCYSSYDAAGNPASAMVTPTIVNGAITYNGGSTPLLVTYSVSGTRLLRTQTVQATGAVSTLVICNNVNNFQLAFTELTTTVSLKITFAPRFRLGSASPAAGTTLAGTASVRGVRFQ
jgi:type II secretory pathway pseudopilin PulG